MRESCQTFAPMNVVFVLLFVIALIAAALKGDVKTVGQGALDGAGSAVTLAIGLIGVMSLWLGLLKIAERAGLVEKLSRAALATRADCARRLFHQVLVTKSETSATPEGDA